MKKIVLISIIIDNKVLMVNSSQSSYSWDFPGGQISAGEKITEAANNYFYRKTGYKLKIIGINKIYNCIDNGGKQTLVFNLAGKLDSGKINPNNHKVRWISTGIINQMDDSKLKNSVLTKKIVSDNEELKPVPISLIEDLSLNEKLRYDKIKNMPNFLKNGNFPLKLFIGSSLVIFFLLLSVAIIANIRFNPARNKNTMINADKYYLNKHYQDGDELVTKVPNLKDMLAGPIITTIDPNFGSKNSNNTIVEFSDFQCKYCQEQEQIFRSAVVKHKLRLIWKDAPDSKISSPSYQAAIAARCADKQNNFWPYHDRLFADKNLLNRNGFIQIAKELKLDTVAFSTCLDKMETKSLVDDNIKEANALDIKGIPFVYVNNQEIMGQITADDLENIIKTQTNK